MKSHSAQSLETWLDTLPYSKMAPPSSLWGKVKYLFWHFYTPYHPMVRDAALYLGMVEHEGRQNFLFGKVAEHHRLEDFVMHLVERGFGNHFVAWKDEGELASLRFVDGFEYQYHLRIFADREVRGHYEYTPECYPISHMKDENMEERRDFFLSVIQDWLE